MGRVEGRIAVVTGGAMGMGNGSATQLAKEGAHVSIIDYSDTGAEAADKLREYDSEATFYKADVSDFSAMKEIYDEIGRKYGRIDISVNAAGIGEQRRFLEQDEAWMDKYLSINYKGVWNACRNAIPHMIGQKYGKIVNFSSVTGIYVVDPGMTHYAATKGAIMGLTKGLASEFAPYGITVNAILPGMVNTPLAQRAFAESDPEHPEEIAAAVDASIPIGRMGTIEEAGRTVLYLASDDSSYITGVGLVFDGGSTLPEMPGTGWEPA
jgi:NAD(P)-dependent dehydrogenase (short-subunit alcohol dehydrogenase family)